MKNPWLAKNPFLSMWLSTANRVLGAARGHALSEARRQQRSMMNESARTIMGFWSGAALSPPAKRKSRRSR